MLSSDKKFIKARHDWGVWCDHITRLNMRYKYLKDFEGEWDFVFKSIKEQGDNAEEAIKINIAGQHHYIAIHSLYELFFIRCHDSMKKLHARNKSILTQRNTLFDEQELEIFKGRCVDLSKELTGLRNKIAHPMLYAREKCKDDLISYDEAMSLFEKYKTLNSEIDRNLFEGSEDFVVVGFYEKQVRAAIDLILFGSIDSVFDNYEVKVAGGYVKARNDYFNSEKCLQLISQSEALQPE